MISEHRQQQIIQAAAPKHAELLNIPGVTCVYPGTRLVNGVDTGEECMIVGVVEKKPLDQISPENRIPRRLGKIVPTDVVEIPRLESHTFCGENATTLLGCSGHIYNPVDKRPYSSLPGGVSIGNANIYDAGTLGTMVRDRDTRELMGLTSNHAVGPQVFLPDPNRGVIEYDVTDNENTLLLAPTNQPELSTIEPTFSDYQTVPYNETFGGLLAGNLYKFNCKTEIFDFYISTSRTKQQVGGGGLFPFTTVSIQDVNGNIRYNNGAGTGGPFASAGESLYMYFDPTVQLDTDIWYGAHNYPNVGAQMTVMYCGVPPHVTKNHDQPPGVEYSNGRLKQTYENIIGNGIGHPGNVDANKSGSGQIFLGNIKNTIPIKFCHPFNTVQPVNRVDAATIRFDPTTAEASADIVGLTNKPVVARTANVGDHVFKSGRTTGVTPSGAVVNDSGGVVGYNNPCLVTSTNFTAIINYSGGYPNTIQGSAVFENCIYYVLSGEHFAGPGDSGSALLVRDFADGGRLKLAGIHMAGGQIQKPGGELVTFGVACPVARVFQDLNLAVWEGTIIVGSDKPCIKVDGMCYERDSETFTAITHTNVDEVFDDCGKCEDD